LLPLICGAIGALALLAGTRLGVLGALLCAGACFGLHGRRPWGLCLAGTLAFLLGAYHLVGLAAVLVSAIAPVKPAHLEREIVRLGVAVVLCVALLVMTAFAGLAGRHLCRRK
jgi:uncharacterized membrane protein